jgi:hypothetical protein
MCNLRWNPQNGFHKFEGLHGLTFNNAAFDGINYCLVVDQPQLDCQCLN